MMDLSSLTPAQRWTHFINEELKIRQRMEWKSFNGNYPNSDELQEWVPAAGVKPTKEELQIWWGAVGNIWREYSRQNAVGINPNPPPANLASIMAVLCGY